jgi:hypothetical protein
VLHPVPDVVPEPVPDPVPDAVLDMFLDVVLNPNLHPDTDPHLVPDVEPDVDWAPDLDTVLVPDPKADQLERGFNLSKSGSSQKLSRAATLVKTVSYPTPQITDLARSFGYLRIQKLFQVS